MNSTSSNSTFDVDVESEKIGRAGYAVMGIYLTFNGVVATVGNLFVIVILTTNRKLLNKPNNILLMNLAVSDVGVSVLGYPATTISAFAGRWLFGDVGCVIEGFSVTLCCLSSINTLLAMSIVRYILICKPQYQYILNRRETMAMILIVSWVYSIAWAAFPLMGWSSYDYERFLISCSIKWDGTTMGDITYTIMLIVFEYGMHLIIMVFCYSKILGKSAVALGRLKNQTTNTAEDVKQTHKLKHDHKLNVMIVSMVVTFMLIWSPYTFVALWCLIDSASVPLWCYTLPTLFAKSSCSANPFIYGFTNPAFREEVKKKYNAFMNRARVSDMDEAARAIRERIARQRQIYSINATNEGVYIGNQEVSLGSVTMF